MEKSIIQEVEFKGSPLESTLTNTKKVELHHNAVKYALQCQPDSKFWKKAFELINKRNNKKNHAAGRKNSMENNL